MHERRPRVVFQCCRQSHDIVTVCEMREKWRWGGEKKSERHAVCVQTSHGSVSGDLR